MTDIKQLKKEKAKLEQNVLTLLQNFQEKFEVNINNIDMDHMMTVGPSYKKVGSVDVEMRF